MKVRVDQSMCDTSGVCVKEHPNFFRFQEGSKKAEPLITDIPTALEETFVRIADSCPKSAIILEP